MERTVITARDVHEGGGSAGAGFFFVRKPDKPKQDPDGYSSRLLKYIPAEVVTLYLTLQGAIINSSSSAEIKTRLLWGVSSVLLAMTPLYLWRVAGVWKVGQLIVSTLAFQVWVFALADGPFSSLPWYQPIYGTVVLSLYTFLIALLRLDS